jgi:hypothetical protein
LEWMVLGSELFVLRQLVVKWLPVKQKGANSDCVKT